MKKFFALYLAPVPEIEKLMAKNSPEEMQKGMEVWQKWIDDHKEVLAEVGNPLGKTKRITADGISDVKNEVTGYSIVEAESHAAAAELFEDHPHLEIPGAYVDILTVVEMPGT